MMKATIPVDYSKIEKIFVDYGINKKQFDKSIGHTDGFCRHLKHRKTIAPSDYMLIKKIYNIDIRDYAVPELQKCQKSHDNKNELVQIQQSLDSINNLLVQILNKL